MNFTRISILCLIVCNSSILHAQLDWRSWTSVQLNYKANDRITLKAKPLIRHKSDLSKYDNTSIDLIVSLKINSKWSASFLNRHWFLPDQGDREFWFFDLSHKTFSNEKFSFSNRIRYHRAVNWNRDDADFFRYAPKFSFNLGKRFQPHIMADFFYRLSTERTLGGGRYIFGTDIKLSKRIKLTTQYWRQLAHSDEYPIGEENVIVTNIAINLN